MRIGILTGGGDCPGLNAVIRAVTRRALDRGDEVIGILHGWRGLMEGTVRELSWSDISGLLPRGGTIIRTSRTNPFKIDGGVDRALAGLASLDALVAIGGEDTLGVAARLHAEHGAHVVGVPKTIDNDLNATDVTFGFDTAVTIATEAVDRLHSTAESHDRVMVCEVMGRHAGWIALHSGMAGGADVILIPELPLSVERCCELISRRHARGKDFSIVVVSEGWPLTFESGPSQEAVGSAEVDQFGHSRLGGIGAALGGEIEARTGYETRVTSLGHVQRGGSPTARDRVLATRFGVKADELVTAGAWGRMASLQGVDIVDVPLADAVAELKTVPPELYAEAQAFFG
jgi:phosphofructokinase-like protein